MTGKKYEIVDGDISDGYHTFGELYDHRCLLFINLCLADPKRSSWSPEHYEGWDLIRHYLPAGQISYHVPIKYRPLYQEKLENRPDEWDGHKREDVLLRLQDAAIKKD